MIHILNSLDVAHDGECHATRPVLALLPHGGQDGHRRHGEEAVCRDEPDDFGRQRCP